MKSSITSLENSQPSADRNSIMSTMIPEISLDAPSPLDTGPVPSGVASPDPLLGPASRRDHGPIDRKALAKALRQSPLQRPSHDITDRDEVMPDPMLELSVIRSRRAESFAGHRGPSHAGLEGEAGSPTDPISQGVPPELSNFLAEIIFVAVCSAGQIVFSLTYGHATVAQFPLRDALGISASQAPWLVGSSLLASGLSVIIAGSLADLAPPKPLMVGAFLWQAAWNAVMAGVIRPELRVLFFVARAMQGLSVGILVSASMSILGRVYKPGLRKTRVFSAMAGASPLGFWIGCLQGGALSAHLPWIFGTTAIFLGLCAVAAQLTLPDLSPAKDSADADAPSLKNFDYLGAVLSSVGCALVLFGLTQGSSAHWSPYTYSLIILGCLMFVGFSFVERRVSRPLIPNGLWKTPGFAALLIAYFLGFGGYSGAWQFYAIQFWQRYQGASPIMVALYILPNAIVGVLAAFIVSKTLHVFPGHWIFIASMVCFALGPAFFLPQTPTTSYWALSMPGVALATFGPDLSFAAAAIFITSAVPRSYQGSAGALLVTVQNLTSAITTSISDTIGVKVNQLPNGEIGLEGLRAIWWFGLASSLTGALITASFVRIPKAEEKEHVL
ncbi:putative efflux pump antibiotic resistance protein [Eutypa lata UCREL1]|uniref:Putative efflux pump antibiotic resistance protein n=1 Tax=Eutypa lata (strain UCR-EL1) TaxID=1287681 RepID=M7T449_EUTLA|nr:putative efflux pump antibiotic resistance protein [Eutypa lata UCREL1]